MTLDEPTIEAILECLRSEKISINDVSAISIGMDWKNRNEVNHL